MLWSDALTDVSAVADAFFYAPVQVSGVEYDSRRVRPGAIFVAMRGETTDGNQFIDTAVAQGAAAIVTDSRKGFAAVQAKYPRMPVVQVEHGRRALAAIAANLFGHPETQLAVSAVTGTNGKTTTAFLLEAMLRSAGRRCVLVGTIEYHVGDVVLPSPHTTPEARDLLELFRDGVAVGASEAVMEMSSHALEQERAWGVAVDTAIFTNLTQDHLDYHRTMDDYFAAKRRLFAGVGAAAPRVAVLNADDEYGTALADFARSGRSEVVTYGIERETFVLRRSCCVQVRSAFTMKNTCGNDRCAVASDGTGERLQLTRSCGGCACAWPVAGADRNRCCRAGACAGTVSGGTQCKELHRRGGLRAYAGCAGESDGAGTRVC